MAAPSCIQLCPVLLLQHSFSGQWPARQLRVAAPICTHSALCAELMLHQQSLQSVTARQLTMAAPLCTQLNSLC